MKGKKIEAEVPAGRHRFDFAQELSRLVRKGDLLLHHSRNEVLILEPVKEKEEFTDSDIAKIRNHGYRAEILPERRASERD
jgi:hypothetical protein